jgi:sigma-E factor negative regulatory protein RseB
MIRHFLVSSSAALLLLAPAIRAEDAARDWLMRIGRAATTLNYEGTFIYQHDGQVEALRIVHKADDGKVREHIISLTGAAREIVRTDNEVQCFLPDDRVVLVEPRSADNSGFPSILPERLPDLAGNYTISSGRTDRITGRAAQQIFIEPKDEYRYGYQLWSDQDTGLLLRADLLDTRGQLMERFMFTHIRIGAPITAGSLRPENPGEGFVWHRNPNPAVSAPTTFWTATRLPDGFRLSAQMMRPGAPPKKPVEHLVFTDGLATVSVFIEQQDDNGGSAATGTNQMGAVHAFGTRVDEYQVTAVGEVPAATVSMIGGSLARKP